MGTNNSRPSAYLWNFSKLRTQTQKQSDIYIKSEQLELSVLSLSSSLLFWFGFVWSTLHVMFAQARKTPARQKQRRKKSKTEKRLRFKGERGWWRAEADSRPLWLHICTMMSPLGVGISNQVQRPMNPTSPLKLDRHIILVVVVVAASIDLCFYSI